LNTTEAALDLPDSRDDAHRVEDVRRRFIRVIALRDRENQAIAFQRRFDRAQRSRSTSRNRRGEARKDHGSAKRKDRKGLALSHSEYLF
jgi:hypothetical protein